jgi:hypothetical protein
MPTEGKMTQSTPTRRTRSLGLAVVLAAGVAAVGLLPIRPRAQTAPTTHDITFAKDIAPILQHSCQGCHHPDSIAPMSLMTYEEVRPFARAIKQRTATRQMPPWYIEKNIGIQKFLGDPSLSDEQIAKIGTWADEDAPFGSAEDLPPPLKFADSRSWSLGQPDLVIVGPEVNMPALAPDWWGSLGVVPTGVTEDRYVASAETLERNDMPPGGGGNTVGGRFIFHHASFSMINADGTPSSGWVVQPHEVGRNGDINDPEAGRLITAGSSIDFNNMHLHASGRPTKARLEIGLRFHPRDYKPRYKVSGVLFGALDMDVRPNLANQITEGFYTLPRSGKLMNFEPHMHAAAVRMCVEAIYGIQRVTLNCAGYNHNWVRTYNYDPDSAPLLPKGTILHMLGYLDTTPANRNVLDYRNWSGWGQRSVDNMAHDITSMAYMTDEQFAAEVAERREKVRHGQGEIIGCLPCMVSEPPVATQSTSGQR